MHEGEVLIDAALVRSLVDQQFPELAGGSIASVEPWGTDNAIWRLGDDLVLPLPRIYWANEQADNEARWLPVLAPHVPVAVPEPIAVGEPGCGYPYRWAIHRWVPGEGVTLARMEDPVAVRPRDLAAVVCGLRHVPAQGAPAAVGRALPLRAYADAAEAAIESASRLIDAGAAKRVWEKGDRRGALLRSAGLGARRPEGTCRVRDGRLVWNRRLAGCVHRRSRGRCPSRVVAVVHSGFPAERSWMCSKLMLPRSRVVAARRSSRRARRCRTTSTAIR